MGFIEEQLIKNADAKRIYKTRHNQYIEKKIPLYEKDTYLKDGFEEYKKANSKFCYVRKMKEHDELFEDKVWCAFYKMGFNLLSQDRNFKLKNGEGIGNTKQIDVFCVDEDVILIIECKSKKTLQQGTFKDNIDAYKGNMEGFKKYIQDEFGREKKIVFIFATNNVIWSEADDSRLKSIGYVKKVHLDEENIDYYDELSNNLGNAAKYQLLGSLFSGDEIKSMDAEVPAIRGKMGNTIYYSFLIEPEKLLKFCYVLHRNSSHSTKDLSPSYQRIIKKDRLKHIRDFVNDGNFFPNSIIISIDTKNPNDKELNFDLSGKELRTNTNSRIGVLHLPKTYQSAFIIDGQHRLYGYTGTKYASTETIPVIAFVNMDKSDQVKMFMDINQNQKPVAKNLRNTLEEFLLWDSKKPEEVRKAIMLRISMHLGSNNKSPLFKRIITGEDQKTHTMCITLETMRLALAKTNFFNTYKNGQLKENGFFDFGDSNNDKDKTLDYVCKILENYFNGIKNGLPDLWDAGDEKYLSINNTIYGLIILLSEFITYLKNKEKFDTKTKSCVFINNFINDELIDILNIKLSELTQDDIDNHLLKRGAGGTAEAGRFLCYLIHTEISDFSPSWLTQYIDDYFQNNNSEALSSIKNILDMSRDLFRTLLKENYGENWSLLGIDQKTNLSLTAKKNENDRVVISNGGTTGDTDILSFADFGELDSISRNKTNWSSLFSKFYKNKNGLFGNEKNILSKLKSIYNDVSKGHNIRKCDFNDLNEFHKLFEEALKANEL